MALSLFTIEHSYIVVPILVMSGTQDPFLFSRSTVIAVTGAPGQIAKEAVLLSHVCMKLIAFMLKS